METVIRGHCKLAIPVSFLLLWILCPLSARAAATQTFLVLETDPVIAVGVHPTVTVRLTTAAGWVGGVPLEIRLDGHQTKRLLTNRDGRARTVLAKDLDAGDYKVQAVFKGTSDFLASQSAVAIIHVTPASLTIQTVPPLPNVPLLKLDGGRPLSTGADGTIRILIARVRRYELEVTLPPTDSDRQLTFDRWGDGSRESKRTIRLPGRANLAVGLEVSYRVAFSFVDSTGTAVDPARIQSLRVANSRGDVLQPRSFASEWLIGNQIVRREGGLTSVPIEYRIQEVEVRGSNVVDRGRLHFRPDGELATWVIPLLLFSLTVSGQDALFGFALGSSVQLAYPDGSAESVALDEHASATITALPRGNYRAVIEHPPGIPVSTPLVLSRDHLVRVPVISYLDAAFVLGAGLSIAVTLVLFGGRPVGQIGRRALRRIAGDVLMVLRGQAVLFATRMRRAFVRVIRLRSAEPASLARRVLAVREMPGRLARRLSRAAAFQRPWKPARSMTILEGSQVAAASPIEVAVAASPQLPGNELASRAADLASGAQSGAARSAPTRSGRGKLSPASAGRNTGRSRSTDPERRQRKCPTCGNPLTPRAQFCRACGRRIRKS